MSRVSSAELVPTFTTAVNTWQCDENDHLNVQYYTEFGHEASIHLLHQLGLGPQAQRTAGLTLSVRDDHIRYLREFRVIDSVEARSAPVAISDRELVLSQIRGTLLSLENGAGWVGFTSTTGGEFENHDMLMWSFRPNTAPSEFVTRLSSRWSARKIRVSDGVGKRPIARR